MDIKQAYLSKPWLKYYPAGVPEAPPIPDRSGIGGASGTPAG